jgi:hypothetical protein
LFGGTELDIFVYDYRVRVRVTGVKNAVVEIGEQFAWLGAACQSSPTDEMRYSKPRISIYDHAAKPGTYFTLNSSKLDLVSDERRSTQNGSCWHSLFRNPVLVKGFPILARKHKEKGLEIPLNMMAGLGEATRATNFDGSLVMKGFSTMFVLTGRTENSVLWHFLHEKYQNRISYLCARQRCSNPVPIGSEDVVSLESTRHFVGWASSAVTRTGKSRHELRIFHLCLC